MSTNDMPVLNNGLCRVWKETVMAYFEVLFHNLMRTWKYQRRPHSV